MFCTILSLQGDACPSKSKSLSALDRHSRELSGESFDSFDTVVFFFVFRQ